MSEEHARLKSAVGKWASAAPDSLNDALVRSQVWAVLHMLDTAERERDEARAKLEAVTEALREATELVPYHGIRCGLGALGNCDCDEADWHKITRTALATAAGE